MHILLSVPSLEYRDACTSRKRSTSSPLPLYRRRRTKVSSCCPTKIRCTLAKNHLNTQKRVCRDIRKYTYGLWKTYIVSRKVIIHENKSSVSMAWHETKICEVRIQFRNRNNFWRLYDSHRIMIWPQILSTLNFPNPVSKVMTHCLSANLPLISKQHVG